RAQPRARADHRQAGVRQARRGAKDRRYGGGRRAECAARHEIRRLSLRPQIRARGDGRLARGLRTVDRSGRCLSRCLTMHDYPLKQRTIGRLLADKAKRIGDKTWLIYGEDRYSYAQAHEITNRYANGFSGLGIKKGDHVAAMLPNCPEFIWTIWGLGKLGAVTVPLNTAARGDLLRYFITQSDSCCVVVSAEWADRVAEALAGENNIRAFITLGDPGTKLA